MPTGRVSWPGINRYRNSRVGACPGGEPRRKTCHGPSREQPLNDLAVDVRQAEVATLKAIRQALVIDSQQMQERRLEVVDVDRILGRAHGQRVRGTVR